SQTVQNLDYRRSELFEIVQTFYVVIGNKAEVEISKIVINRATAGYSAYDLYIFLLHIFVVYFFQSILVAANNDAWFVDIKKQIISVRAKISKGIFLQSQV